MSKVHNHVKACATCGKEITAKRRDKMTCDGSGRCGQAWQRFKRKWRNKVTPRPITAWIDCSDMRDDSTYHQREMVIDWLLRVVYDANKAIYCLQSMQDDYAKERGVEYSRKEGLLL